MNSVKEVMISLAIELVDDGDETSLHSFARAYQSLFFLSREDLSPLLNYDSVTHDGDDEWKSLSHWPHSPGRFLA